MWKGSFVALATPFDEHNRIDYEAVARLVEFHVEQESDGLVVAGTTGESATLTKPEHAELIARVSEIVAGRMTVIAGTGSNSTQQTIDLSLEVQDSDIDGFLLVAPYYNKPVQEGIFRHFTAIADAVNKPVMLYNVPGRTVTDIQPQTLARLARHSNIVAIKDATGDMQRLREQIDLVGEDFVFFSGDDFTLLDFIRGGGSGVVTVSGNVAPRALARLCRAANAGDFDTAKELDDSLQELNTALFVESNPIPVKWAMQQMGLISGEIRLPLTPFDQQFHEQMRSALKTAGVPLAGEE